MRENIEWLIEHYTYKIEQLEQDAKEHGYIISTTNIIEQIRAEIAEYKDDKVIHAEQNEMIDIVLEILDKYR